MDGGIAERGTEGVAEGANEGLICHTVEAVEEGSAEAAQAEVIPKVLAGVPIAVAGAEEVITKVVDGGGVREELADEGVEVESGADSRVIVVIGILIVRREIVGEKTKNCMDNLGPRSLGVTHIRTDVFHSSNALFVAYITHAHKNCSQRADTCWRKTQEVLFVIKNPGR